MAANGGPKGGDPNPTSWQRLEEIHGRGNGPELTRDEVYPDPVRLEAPELLPTSAEDPTDELHEIQEALGINPQWTPNMSPVDD